ncbi:response regulator [Sphingomonas sp. RT2P30]|uniref:response regulator transcription factor n=1 Tax=Parasphingomonas halimpatiens TaxID=3096162 RepID=UPI002FC68125
MALIFIADDDEIVRDLVQDALRTSGHRAGAVTNGKDMLAAVWTRNPDLVILDCNMPEYSGLLVLKELRNSMRFFDLPVIMLTGRTGSTDMGIALSAGADDYIGKPFAAELVACRVDALLDRKRRAASTSPQVQTCG